MVLCSKPDRQMGSCAVARDSRSFSAPRLLEFAGWSALAVARAAEEHKLDPRAVAVAERQGKAKVIVSLVEQADVGAAYRIPDKAERSRYVFGRLVEVAARTQPPLVAWLARQGVPSKPLWIVNALVVEAAPATLRSLAARPEVAAVRLAGSTALIEPIPLGRRASEGEQLQVAERNVKQINADEVWKLGYTGQGAVVAVTDTGVAYRHAALKAAYRGAGGSHDYNWFDAVARSPEPVDEDSHGTHVTGIVVGEAGARQIGVAPGARWIACRLIERRTGPDEATLACLQWVLAPTRVDGSEPRPELAPDVVNASWGGLPGKDCEGLPEIRAAVQNVVASGILFVAAAGNSGPDCATICAPAMYPEPIAVANYDGRGIADSSSRGPVRYGSREEIKPDLAAPGTGINSSIPPQRYDEKSGSSMAAPHVTGVAALLLSARPDFRGRPEVLRRLLETTARPIRPDRCGPPGQDDFNNSAGHGLVDARAAVLAALSATPPPTPTEPPSPTATEPPSPTPTVTLTATAEPTSQRPTVTPRPHFAIYLPTLGRRWTAW